MKSHTIRGGSVGRGRSRTVALALVGLVLAGTLTACASTKAQPATSTSGGSSSSSSGIPAAAFSDTTGLTSSTVTIGNVSTLAFGLFKGADVGTQAWADYVNSTGGINGRKVVVDSYDDGYQGAPNQQATEEVAEKLRARGFSAAAINGDIAQAQRERVIAAQELALRALTPDDPDAEPDEASDATDPDGGDAGAAGSRALANPYRPVKGTAQNGHPDADTEEAAEATAGEHGARGTVPSPVS